MGESPARTDTNLEGLEGFDAQESRTRTLSGPAFESLQVHHRNL